MAARVYGSEVRTVILKGMEIRYEFTRKSVKNVNLRIDAAGNVKVSASRRVPVEYIEGFMREKQEQIITAVDKAEKNSLRQEKEQRQYIDGENLMLLGNRLEIKITESGEECVYPDNGFLYFKVKNPDDMRHRELLYEKWLKSYQYGVYEEVCRKVYRNFRQYGVDYPVIKVRRMTSRWGSCQPYKGIVTLNSRLIETPLCCLEYVAMHEFCHFIHPDHSKAFHALMTSLMPDWKQRKQLLNSIKEWN